MAIRGWLRPPRAVIHVVLIVLAFCLLTSYSLAQDVSTRSAGTTSANFLRMGIGARACALGGAFVAIADDATAGYWNPAGLPQIGHLELVFMHNNWYQDITSDYLGVAVPVSRTLAFGLNVSYVDYGSFEGYDINDQPTGEYSANAYVVSSSSALKLSRCLSVGLTGKIISEKLDQTTAIGYALDMGALYRTSVVSAGVNLMNVGRGLKYEVDECPLPHTLLTGLAVNLYEGRFRIASDFEIPSDRSVTIHQGVEYCYENTVFLRTGYCHDFGNSRPGGSTAMTAGFGVKHSIGAVDYSYWPDDHLGDIHRISFRLIFGNL